MCKSYTQNLFGREHTAQITAYIYTIIHTKITREENKLRRCLNEIQLLQHMHHPRIIKIFASWANEKEGMDRFAHDDSKIPKNTNNPNTPNTAAAFTNVVLQLSAIAAVECNVYSESYCCFPPLCKPSPKHTESHHIFTYTSNIGKIVFITERLPYSLKQ